MAIAGIHRDGDVHEELTTESTSLLWPPSLYAPQPPRRNNSQDNTDTMANPRGWCKIIIVSIIVIIGIIFSATMLLNRNRSHSDDTSAPSLPIREDYNYNENTNSMTTISSSAIRHDIVENYQPEKLHVNMPPPVLYLSNVQEQQQQQNQSNRDENENGPLSLRWGILGLGRIAHDFTSTLIVLGCNVTAVASATPSLPIANVITTITSDNSSSTTITTTSTPVSALARAKSFATHFSIPTYYDSYKKLASDPNVDIVYVATTNQNHLNPTLLMLRAGKNVLVEKPSAVTYQEAQLMYDEAEKRGLFLMTNHWTRFFPLVKYLRQTFLLATTTAISNSSIALEESEVPSSNQTMTSAMRATKNHADNAKQHSYNLGKVLAMHGDFSFITPVNPTDRFLNRSLGGGVTLDVGCYLVELALLAAYDHEQSHPQSAVHRVQESTTSSGGSKGFLMEYLRPEDVVATGHGVYHGVSYPVDVESSFSLRWGGGPDGIDVCDADAGHGDANGKTGKRRLGNTSNCGESSNHKLKLHASTAEQFTMIATFQASFRRPSNFEVEYTFERGRILIHGPGNCPSEMTVYEYEQPYGPVFRETKITFPLPLISNAILQYGQPNYPRAEGFAYVIDAIEKCMAEKGIPGRSDGRRMSRRCLELKENTVEEQLVTVEVTEKVLTKIGYFGRRLH